MSPTQPHSIPMGWLSPFCSQGHMWGQQCPQPSPAAPLWGGCHPAVPRGTWGLQCPQPSPTASLWGDCHPAGTRDRQGLQCPQPSPAASLWGGCRPTVTRNTCGDSGVPSPTSQHPYRVTVTLQVPETDRDCSVPNPALQHPYGVAAARDKWDSSVPNPAHPYGVALWGRADPDPMDALASPRARRSPHSWWGSRGGRSFCRWPPGWSRWPTWRSRGPGH